MKKLIVTMIAVLALASVVQAADPASPPAPEQKAAVPAATVDQKFEQRKAKALQHIEIAEGKLKTARACIEAAKDSTALKACRPKDKHHKANKPKQENATTPAK